MFFIKYTLDSTWTDYTKKNAATTDCTKKAIVEYRIVPKKLQQKKYKLIVAIYEKWKVKSGSSLVLIHRTG